MKLMVFDLMFGLNLAKFGKSEGQSELSFTLLPENNQKLILLISITLSPVYPAAASLLGSERGLSVRFPRFMKIREDKGWEQATTAEQFAEMYRKQIKEAPSRVKVEPGEVVIRQGSEEKDEVDGEGIPDYGDGDGDGEYDEIDEEDEEED